MNSSQELYKEKYLKYKQKYLELKNQIAGYGCPTKKFAIGDKGKNFKSKAELIILGCNKNEWDINKITKEEIDKYNKSQGGFTAVPIYLNPMRLHHAGFTLKDIKNLGYSDKQIYELFRYVASDGDKSILKQVEELNPQGDEKEKYTIGYLMDDIISQIDNSNFKYEGYTINSNRVHKTFNVSEQEAILEYLDFNVKKQNLSSKKLQNLEKARFGNNSNLVSFLIKNGYDVCKLKKLGFYDFNSINWNDSLLGTSNIGEDTKKNCDNKI